MKKIHQAVWETLPLRPQGRTQGCTLEEVSQAHVGQEWYPTVITVLYPHKNHASNKKELLKFITDTPCKSLQRPHLVLHYQICKHIKHKSQPFKGQEHREMTYLKRMSCISMSILPHVESGLQMFSTQAGLLSKLRITVQSEDFR
jgi:hypothetical protein